MILFYLFILEIINFLQRCSIFSWMAGNSHYFSTFHILDLFLMLGLAGSNMSLLVSITVFWLQAQVLQRRGRWWRPSDPRRKRGRTRWKRPELEMETEFLEFTKLRIYYGRMEPNVECLVDKVDIEEYMWPLNLIHLNILRFRAKNMPQMTGKWQGVAKFAPTWGE